MDRGPIEIVQFLQLFGRLGDGWPAVMVLGVFAGFLVRFATTSRRTVGLWSTLLLGIAGAFLGVGVAAWLGVALHGSGARFLAALAGSFVLALLAGLLQRDKSPSP